MKSKRTLVSSITAQRMPVLTMACLRLSRVSWWYSWEPWEKLNLATFIPALSSFSIIGTDLDAGPSVQTIFVLGTLPSLGRSFMIPSMLMFDIFLLKSETPEIWEEEDVYRAEVRAAEENGERF